MFHRHCWSVLWKERQLTEMLAISIIVDSYQVDTLYLCKRYIMLI